MYAKVENGAVVKTMGQLPKVHTFADGSKTGNFDLASSDVRIAEGYYPMTDEVVSFDPKKQVKAFSGYTINADSVVKNYTVVDTDLGVLKANKKAEIERYTQSLVASSKFEFDGDVFTLDLATPDNAVQLDTVAQTTGVFPDPFSWTDSYGVEVIMNETKFHNFISVLGAYKLGIIVNGKTHKALVDSKTTADEVVDYDFSTGWGNYVEPVEEEII
jgi:hypothetical protein